MIHSHLLGLQISDPVEVERKMDHQLDVDWTRHQGAKLTLCARVLDSVGRGELPVDNDVVDLLVECEKVANDAVEADRRGHRCDFADSQERLAMVRVILDVARARREGGDADG